MAAKPAGEKSEKATPRKLKKARRDGQIAHTPEIGSWLSVLAASFVLPAVARALMDDARTTFVQVGSITWPSLAAGTAVGALACAILVANNLRDVHTDGDAGKRTLAVALGEARTRTFFVVLGIVAWVAIALSALATPFALLGLIGVLPWSGAAGAVRSGATGPALIPVLQRTGVAELVAAVGLAVGLALGA
jgi:1,4-dihydroxy-2-naphthoate octaprenyltransferase